MSYSQSGMPGVPSIQGSILRLFLRFRKATTNWNAPVTTFRAKAKWSDRFTRLPRDVEFKPLMAANVPVEWITPLGVSTQSVILYFHGGGGTLGWHNLERRMVACISHAASGRALAVDYRLAPEHPFPAALEDCLGAYRWLLSNGISARNIVITGGSAGANLTLATLISLRDAGDPLPAGAVCLSPITDLKGTGDSFTTKNDPAASSALTLSMARQYAGNQDMRAPLLSPHYGDLRGLPPLLIQVGGDEILLSDATRLAENGRAAGVDVNLVIWPGMWHAWQLFVPHLPEARQAVSGIGTFIRERTTALQK
jgi:monoterpene epsilon-lactone hydrolase